MRCPACGETETLHIAVMACGACGWESPDATIETLKREIITLQTELDGFRQYKQHIDECLNSGNGVYRP